MKPIHSPNSELPPWVSQVALPQAKPAAFKVLYTVFSFGDQRVGSYGERRCYLNVPMARLGKLAGLSRDTVIEAEKQLQDLGFLTVHGLVRDNTPHAVSAPYDLFESPGFAPAPAATAPQERIRDGEDASQVRVAGVSVTAPQERTREFKERGFRPGGVGNSDSGGVGISDSSLSSTGGFAVGNSDTSLVRARKGWSGGGGVTDPDTVPVRDQVTHPTTTTPREAVGISDTVVRLRELGYRSPVQLIDEFGIDQVEAAIAITKNSDGIRNPAAFVRHLLRDSVQSRRPLEMPVGAPEETYGEHAFDVNARYRELAEEMFGKRTTSLTNEEFSQLRSLVLGGPR